MVTPKMLRTHEVKYVFSDKKKSICALDLKMSSTDQIADITTYVRTSFWVNIQYKHHGLDICFPKIHY